MTKKLEQALDNFIDQYRTVAEQQGGLWAEYDEQWPSSCVAQPVSDGEWVEWQPVKQENEISFDNLSEALEVAIDPQLAGFFGRYFSDNLEASTQKGKLTLLQVWSADDLERLQQNLIGHVLMKRQLRQPITLFFALTDEEDFIISIDNQTGEVVLEQVGKLPCEVLAPNLAEFLAQLTPIPPAKPT